MQDAIYSVPILTMDDVEHSVGGCILGDYQTFLRGTGDIIKNIVKDANADWEKKDRSIERNFGY